MSIWRNWEMERGEVVLREWLWEMKYSWVGEAKTLRCYGNQSDLTELIIWFNASNFLQFFFNTSLSWFKFKGIDPIITPNLSQNLQKMFFAEKAFSGMEYLNVSQNIRGLRVLEPTLNGGPKGFSDRQLTPNFELLTFLCADMFPYEDSKTVSVCPYPEKKNHLSFANISNTFVIDTSMARSSRKLHHGNPKMWIS